MLQKIKIYGRWWTGYINVNDGVLTDVQNDQKYILKQLPGSREGELTPFKNNKPEVPYLGLWTRNPDGTFHSERFGDGEYV